jgi:hypothetical protein
MTDYVPYQAYLIRLWPTRHEGAADCRVSLHNISTGESETFAGLGDLLAFLKAQRGAWENPGGTKGASDTTLHTVGKGDE